MRVPPLAADQQSTQYCYKTIRYLFEQVFALDDPCLLLGVAELVLYRIHLVIELGVFNLKVGLFHQV